MMRILIADETGKSALTGGADYFFDQSTEYQKLIAVLMGMLPDPAKKRAGAV